MGNYISRTDVQDRLQRTYTTLYTVSGSVDTDKVDQDIAGAEAEIDGYVATRYAVPVTGDAVALLKDLALALAEERAYRRAPNLDMPGKIADAAKTARAQLRDIAAGRMSLGAATVPDERSAATGAMVIDAETPEYTRDKLAGW